MDAKLVWELYDKEGMSLGQIAKKFDTYPNEIRRLLIKNGYVLRTKAAAQSNALKTGTSKHPTKGRQRTESEKNSISIGISANWKMMTQEERQIRINVAKKNWDKLPQEKKEDIKRRATEGLRISAQKGSKLERYLLIELGRQGYTTNFHEDLPTGEGETLQVDMYIKSLNVAIEVDGPSHFYPIWGQERLEKQIHADKSKNGLLLSNGYSILRVIHLTNSLSSRQKKDALTVVLEILEKIKADPDTDSIYEVEII